MSANLASALLGSVVAFGLAVWCSHRIGGAARRWTLSRRFARARTAEHDAEPLLRGAGYRILGRQVPASLDYVVDGRTVRVDVQTDLLVSRRGRRYVAEVKSGRHAPDMRTSSTRRQILEYAHAYRCDGLLLVDPERGRIHEIEIPSRLLRRSRPWFSWLFGS